MKNNFLKYYTTAFFFCSTFMMFAQPGSGSDNGGIDDSGEADITPGTPIDDYVWILALIGLTFVFLKFRAQVKQSKIC